jgi:hypothetical protein
MISGLPGIRLAAKPTDAKRDPAGLACGVSRRWNFELTSFLQVSYALQQKLLALRNSRDH